MALAAVAEATTAVVLTLISNTAAMLTVAQSAAGSGLDAMVLRQ
jgi:hypothetical protein